MFSFLKRKQQPPRDLEHVIYDIAEKQLDADFRVLYSLMRDRQVFVPTDLATVPLVAQPGQSYTTTANDRVEVRTMNGPSNQLLACAATNQQSPLLKDGYVGMSWLGFLEMAIRLDPSINGFLLQGTTSWVVFDRVRIRYILGNFNLQ